MHPEARFHRIRALNPGTEPGHWLRVFYSTIVNDMTMVLMVLSGIIVTIRVAVWLLV